jgi:hypothetical protein
MQRGERPCLHRRSPLTLAQAIAPLVLLARREPLTAQTLSITEAGSNTKAVWRPRAAERRLPGIAPGC